MINILDSDFVIDNNLVQSETLRCWKRQQGAFNIHFFTSIHHSQDELISSYGRIRDYIAIYFQGNYLKLDIERWNIYQIHLLTFKIDADFKQLVEQDKFATRKIIIDSLSQVPDEHYIKDLINKQMFQFSIERRVVNNLSIMEVITKEDKQLATYIQQIPPDKDQLINSLLINFGDGQN
ncbi:hypothetical protein N180_15560 [Pedobacter antarcticus 4BY]|uniref:Uncharacterized protein n=2 Tax=Pedobacter antarcticus TaxID=34086 RepID=A0A081PLT0_9SPHI|nr:ABC-three component system middle component 1 [Pedobacter antarcticus]KEQ31653.1 hypothetical protein N180_15560 [Pedobacter antarcticus 4BY]SFE33779.1 hypothetical protein SAMN03003324_00130 [Pedobacter antarcticus]